MTGEGRKGDTAQWVQDKISHSLPAQVSSVLSQQPAPTWFGASSSGKKVRVSTNDLPAVVP